MKPIAITGGRGFIGTALRATLASRGIPIVEIPRGLLAADEREKLVGELAGTGAVIHAAGLTPHRGPNITEADFEFANRQLTHNLAVAAIDAGVPRLVFISSIAVVAGHTGPLIPEMPISPVGAYGRSKAAAEADLRAQDGLESIIVRPPAVYGPGATGDLQSLLSLADSPWPLPFGAVENRRSMVGVANLADALRFLATTDAIGGIARTLHVCDAEPVSLARIIAAFRDGFGRRRNLVRVPPSMIRVGLRAAGMSGIAQKLLGDLIVDGSGLNRLGWHPPNPPETDLLRMALAASQASPGSER